MRKEKIEKKIKILPTGEITPLRDYFKPYKNIGVFPKPPIERKDDNKWKGAKPIE